MARPRITLFVDTVSPFAYIAYYVLRNDPAFAECDLNIIPILLGGVMKAAGNSPPINIKSKFYSASKVILVTKPDKDKWIGLERKLWSRIYSVPMIAGTPPDFPAFTLSIMRCLCAITILYPGQDMLLKALDVLYQAYWVDGRATHKADELHTVLVTLLGAEGAKKVEELSKTEGKALLVKNTDQAFADGAFGLPWMLCEDSSARNMAFWGCDRLSCIADFLGLEQPKMKSWKAIAVL